jgi:opacity protein-like surface antigen
MKKIILASISALLAAQAAHAQLSAYTPERNQLITTVAYQYQRYDEFWAGDTSVSLKLATGFREQQQHSTYLTLEYGILDDLALDVTVGYSWTEFEGGPVPDLNDDGWTDTTFGLRYRAIDERKVTFLPTVTLRVGGIVAGSYDDAFPFSSGDGADGIETSALLARQLCPGLGLYGEIGYRWRNNNVPDDIFGAVGLAVTYIPNVTLCVGYRHTEGQSGPDIGAPGFGVDFGFPQVKEKDQRIEESISYTDGGGRNYALYFAQTLDGRNTGEKAVFGVSISIPFGGRGEMPAPAYKK